MIDFINEQIEVLVAFMKKKVMPLSFHWHSKKYSVEKINMVYSRKIGEAMCHVYAVTSGNAYFKLCFNGSTNKWTVEEVYFN